MLCRNNRDTFLENIIAHFPAVLNNVWKMVAKSFCRDGAQVFPDKVGAVFCHLFVNFLGKKITGQQLVYETVHVFVVKSGTFATDRFGNQKAAVFRMFGVEGGRVDLHVIRVLQFNIMLTCNSKCVAGKVAEVGGMSVKSTYTSAGQNGIGCSNGVKGTIWTADHSAVAVVVFFQNINQGGVFQKFYIGKLLDFAEQGAGDLFSGYILVENNTVGGMGAFFGVGKAAVFVSLELGTVRDKIPDNLRGGFDHDLYGFFVIFVVSGFHGVFEKAVIVGLFFQHAHAALGEKGIVTGKVGLGDDGDFFVAGKLEGTVKTGAAASCDEDICFHN